jgi:hypothetical protein
MSTAILCWGSLFWNPGSLDYIEPWQATTLKLPIEFSRISKNGRLTLVVDYDHGVEIPVYVARIPLPALADVRESLREREGCPLKHIGRFGALDGRHSECSEADGYSDYRNHSLVAGGVAAWIGTTDYTSAVWTALPRKFDWQGIGFTVERAVAYVASLSGAAAASGD